MIWDFFLETNYLMYKWFLDLIPDLPVSITLPDITPLADTIGFLMYLSSPASMTALFASVIFWTVTEPIANVVKFLYRKIPGIN